MQFFMGLNIVILFYEVPTLCLFLLQDDEDEENGEEEGGLSNSGKELKKLLGKANGLNESEEEEDDDDSDDVSPVQFQTSCLVLIEEYHYECLVS